MNASWTNKAASTNAASWTNPDPWSSPDPHRIVSGTAFGATFDRVEQASPPVGRDLLAGLLTVAVTVLVGAPVGLLWSLLAPRAEAVRAGANYLRADPSSSAYIAGDGFFFAAMLLAGLATGVIAWWFGRTHGPAVVVGLTVGGLLAAFVAMKVGEQVGIAGFEEAVRAGQAMVDINLTLMAREALAGWPIGALIGFAVPTLLDREPKQVSSG